MMGMIGTQAEKARIPPADGTLVEVPGIPTPEQQRHLLAASDVMHAIHSTRPGGHVGYVGVSHGVAIDGLELFFSGVHLYGGPAPVRRFLPELIELNMTGEIAPGDVFDLTLSLDEAAEGYRAMDERRATKVLLCP